MMENDITLSQFVENLSGRIKQYGEYKLDAVEKAYAPTGFSTYHWRILLRHDDPIVENNNYVELRFLPETQLNFF